ncbi:hypothetical protein [Pedobacter nyackensis]|uniref:Uncharacterized protein n=1 Tax=Pedobacter nyackensis TaxID=475255 RepID=A0A1W2DUC0_9SPHI|nr:hypothetical protein [Pedobacter nyackensis]SMD00632.1 hypothetical protein SAMN04488101_10857 [Pedobacter nyackensis]
MEPFNIKVGFGRDEVALTILPITERQYLVTYFGGIIGAVKLDADGEQWEQVPDEEVVAGDLPFYSPDLNSDRLNFVLCEHTVNLIGEEILAELKDR